LSSISANCGRHPKSNSASGQKRKYETISLDENGDDDTARIIMAGKKQSSLGISDDSRSSCRREPTEAEKAPRPSLFEAGEALRMSQKGEEKRYALVSNRVNTLAETTPRPPILL
jgi:hypothetical protein